MRTHSFLLMIALILPLQNICMECTYINDDESPSVFYNVEPPNNISNVEEQTNNNIYCSVANLIALYRLITYQPSENNLLLFNVFYSPKPKHSCHIIFLHFSSLCFIDENSQFRPEYTDNAIIEADNQGGFFLNITGLQKPFPLYANILLKAYKNKLLQKQHNLFLQVNPAKNQMYL